MVLTEEQIAARFGSQGNLVHQLDDFRTGEPAKIKTDNLARIGESNWVDPDLGRDHTELSGVEIKTHVTNPNGKAGTKNLTEDERIAVAVISKTVGEDVAAEMFGISTDHAHHLKSANRTRSSGEGYKDVQLERKVEDRLNKTKTTIQESAAVKLLTAFDLITPDKLENSSARELSQIASQMSQTMRNMTDRTPASEKGSKLDVKIIVHAPKPVTEATFDTVEIGVAKD